MANFHISPLNDQAAGLRKMMTYAQGQIFSLLSTSAQHMHGMPLLHSVASALVEKGVRVLLIHAAEMTNPIFQALKIRQPLSLEDVVQENAFLHETVYDTPYGYSLMQLMPSNHIKMPLDKTSQFLMDQNISQLQQEFDVLLVATTLNQHHVFPIHRLNLSKVLIHLDTRAEAITEGYGLIKKICNQLGKRSFGIVIEGANDDQGAHIFQNMAQVASRFLQLDLEFFGNLPSIIPPDDAKQTRATPSNEARQQAIYTVSQRIFGLLPLAETLAQASMR